MSKQETKKVDKVEHGNIYAALSAFQGEVDPVKKSARVNFKTSKGEVDFSYSPLEEIVNTIKPSMAKHGLSYRHEVKKIDGQDYIEAIITHESYKETPYKETIIKNHHSVEDGENVENITTEKVRSSGVVTSGPIKIHQGNDMKDIGSAITYARRYSLTMALGIASEEDKDVMFMDRAEKAMNFAHKKALNSIQGAKTVESLEKSIAVIQKDLEMVKKGKSGALGLTEEQYEELILEAESKKQELNKK